MKTEFGQNQNKYGAVLHNESLHLLVSMAVETLLPIHQGNCKNAFCQGILSPEEVTIVRPPSRYPDSDPRKYWLLLRTLFGLWHSPRHWYDKINALLQSISLTPSLEGPCIYSGFIVDPSNPSGMRSASPLSLGLYVDDFVYFSKGLAVKALFC